MHYLISSCLLFFAIFIITSANRNGNNEEAIKRGDSYIDKLLEDMHEHKDDYDPYVLEDSVVGFHKKVMFINVTGEAKLHSGQIKGLSTLHRVGHCSLHNETNQLRVKADLGAGELELHYKGSAKFMNFGPTITVEGRLSYIEVHMEFIVNSKTGREGKLTKFIIDDMRGMKVRVSGLGPINWAVNPIIYGVTKIFKRFVRNFMENKVEKHIREHIPNYQFPVEGDENTEAPETIPTEVTTPETEATTPEPETIPTEATTPETEATPPEPETIPTEATTPETEATTPEPETIPTEATLETEVPDETEETESEMDSLDVTKESEIEETEELEVESPDKYPETKEINLPETPDTSIAEEVDLDETEDASEQESRSSKESYIPDSDIDNEM